MTVDVRDSSLWTPLMHAMKHIDYNECFGAENSRVRHADAMSCLSLLVRHGADMTLTDTCNCPCSPRGCSAVSIALHKARQNLRPCFYFRINSFSALPIDMAIIALDQNRGLDLSQSVASSITDFATFLGHEGRHSCCAFERCSPGLFPSTICAPEPALMLHGNDPSPGSRNDDITSQLAHQLARVYNLLERMSRAKHDGYKPNDKPSKPHRMGLWFDEPRDTYGISFGGWNRRPPALRVDLQEYQSWLAWCVQQDRHMFSKQPLRSWAANASAFVEKLERELDRLRSAV